MPRRHFPPLLAATLLIAPGVPLLPVAAQKAPGQAPGQAPAAVQDSMELFVRTHLALQSLRDRIQAELAEPKNKTAENQQALRTTLRTERARILAEHAMTEAQFARMTRWVSVSDSARRVFDALVARAGTRGG